MPTSRVRIDTVAAHGDERGLVYEPLDEAGLQAQRNVHVVLTAPGAVRGNHRHLVGTEVTLVTGPAEVRLREDGVLRDLVVPAGETWRLTIPPGVTHAYRNPGPGMLVIVAFNTELHDRERPDTVRDPIL